MQQRTCTMPGCGKPFRARDLCSTHYNQQIQPNRHRKVTVQCTQCGADCLKEPTRHRRYGGLFCSLICRGLWSAANGHYKGNPAALAKARAARLSPQGRARRKIRKAQRGTRGGTWVAGQCARCLKPFVSQLIHSAGLYCSDTCKRRERSTRRRARERSAHRVPYSRVAIFQRDGYRCHLCRKLTLPHAVVPHPRAPVIDHLVPLGEGDDAPHNVAAACFLCNSKRREVGAAQLLLFG